MPARFSQELRFILRACAVAMFCLTSRVSAQYVFDSWTADNGLPHNSVRALLQSRDGYIWLTTGAGLVRFDGVRFRVFNRSDTPEIPSNAFRIRALVEDRQGGIWAGTDKGAIRRYKEGFAFYPLDALPSSNVIRIDEDAEGAIWIFTTQGLAKWQDGHLAPIAPQPGSEFNGLLTPPAEYVGFDGRHAGLWRMTRTAWERFAYGCWQAVPLPPHVKEPRQLHINSIVEDYQRRLWFNVKDRPGEYYLVQEGRLSVLRAPPDSYICYRDRNGYAWAANHEAQAVLIKDGIIAPSAEPSTPYVFTAIEDREGGIWIATLDRGLFRAKPRMLTTLRNPGIRETSFVRSLLEDKAGNIWFGSIGLHRFRDGLFQDIFYSGIADLFNARNQPTALYEDRDGSLIVGTWVGALRLRSGKHVPDPTLSEVSGRILAVHRDRTGTLWIGGSKGLAALRGGKITQHTSANGLSGDTVKVLLETRAGKLWAGTSAGLSVIENGKCSSVLYANGPGRSSITTLYEDSAGALWIGTYDFGLFRLFAGRMTRYTTVNGLISDGAFAILEDARGYLWISCPIGIYRVDKQQLNNFAEGMTSTIAATHLRKADGLIAAESASEGQPAGFKSRDGKLWFGTTGGLAVVNPSAAAYTPIPPPVSIEDVRVQGRSVPWEELALQPESQNLEIDYTALSFYNPEQIHFRYKLHGVERDWVEAAHRRTAYYPRLRPASYVFEVVAKNSDGVWSTQPAKFAFTVLPPFYATWWFRLLLMLAIAAAAAKVWRTRSRRWERKQELQQAFSRQVLASQENERRRIAAELHDSLGQRLIIIKNMALLSLQKGSADAAGENLEQISSEASQALREVREISYNLRPYQLDRLGLTKAITALVRTAESAFPVTFSVRLDNIDDVLPQEVRIHFYRIVQECLNNIMKHSQASAASLMIEHKGQHLLIEVTDNGRGFTPEADTVGGSVTGGFGLIGLTERVQLLSGKTEIRSSPGHGTRIHIVIDLEALRNEQEKTQSSG